MGLMNLLKANWTGKVGQTVGAKWKNKSTIRTFTKPAYTNTPAQQLIRENFKTMSSFISLFSDQIKALSAVSTKGMSVRNSIIKLNKALLQQPTVNLALLQVSTGGLPEVQNFDPTSPAGLATLTATWSPAVGATISAKARVVVIFAAASTPFSAIGSALNSAGTISITAAVPPSTQLHVYAYLIDYRGSARVGSVSQHALVTSPAA